MDRAARAETRPGIIEVDGETTSSMTRKTVNDRALTYHLKVEQQPVRARACGQGAKSSADRRPVDPPPIVTLQIFDGDDDITFAMRASYFLFATLEPARVMAHGRVTGERTSPPVLTGTPVAGITYLDRPHSAGYFIFPDLSVRHEGMYRLSFSLYEETKDPLDADKCEVASASNPAGGHVTHRLEVKSEPFQVFSAKKFPGLTESTPLSRMVAEQGCRVRIRRDVRLRRTAAKAEGKEWENYEDETAQAHARVSQTPDPHAYPSSHGYMDPNARPRSASNGSHHSYAGPLSRRPSLEQMGQIFNQPNYGKAPHTPQNGYTQATSYGPSPSPQYPPSYMPQQQHQMQPPPPPPLAPAPPQQGYFDYHAASQTPFGVSPGSYEPPRPQHHPNNYPVPAYAPQDNRRPNGLASRHGPAAYPPQPQYEQPHFSKPQPLEPRNHSIASSHSEPRFQLPPLNTSVSQPKLEASSPLSALPPGNTSYSTVPTPVDSHKRGFAESFNDPYRDQPLRNGARPGTGNGHFNEQARATNLPAAEDEAVAVAEFDPETLDKERYRSFRRADGRLIMREVPNQL